VLEWVWRRSRDCGSKKRKRKRPKRQARNIRTYAHFAYNVRELKMSEGKCALYLGAIFSTLFRIFSYIFLRVVCPFSSSSVFTDNRHSRLLSDGVNT